MKTRDLLYRHRMISDEIPKEVFEKFPVLNRSVMTYYRGSVAHGTYIPNSIDDIDIAAVVVMPEEYYYGLRTFEMGKGTREFKKDQWDIVAHEARKVVSMLAKGNPNVIMSLWLRGSDYIHLSYAGKLLLDSRKTFSTKAVLRSTFGYAKSQLHRMKPGAYRGYMGQKRKEIVDRFGYDTKAASHLIRLLRMGLEFADTGELQVYRPDRQQLIEIKQGRWKHGEVLREAGRLTKALHLAMEASWLPERVNPVAVSNLCAVIVKTGLSDIRICG